MIFLFQKKLRYLKSRISIKFHRLLFFLLFQHLAFFFLFHLSKLIKKLWNFLWCFIGRVRDFTNDFWKILKVLFQKILICETIFFQNSVVYYLFFYFFIIFDILFSILSICICQKILDIFMFLFTLWTRDFIKEFWKIMEYFSEKYRHLKSKILHKFHRLLFVFFFSILVIFFSYFTYPNLSKNSKHFCGALLYGIQILLENSGKFLNF